MHYLLISQVHRRTFQDDGRGVAEALAEPGQFGTGLIIRGRHRVVVDTISKSASLHRTLGEHLMLRPYPIFVFDPSDPEAYKEKYLTSVSIATECDFYSKPFCSTHFSTVSSYLPTFIC